LADKEMLAKYSTLRNNLGWKEEINLFNWADNGFVVNHKTKNEYRKLKIVIEYFSNRKNQKNSLENILKTEFKKLKSLEPEIIEYSNRLF
jgi:hypothetical protein